MLAMDTTVRTRPGTQVAFRQPVLARCIALDTQTPEGCQAQELRFKSGSYVRYDDQKARHVLKGTPEGRTEPFLFFLDTVSKDPAPSAPPKVRMPAPAPSLPVMREARPAPAPVPVMAPSPVLARVPYQRSLVFPNHPPPVRKIQPEAFDRKPLPGWEDWPAAGTLIQCWDERINRMVSVGIDTQDEYLELWFKGHLRHQREGRQKPEHLPSAEDLGHA